MSVYRVQNNLDLSMKGANTVASATSLLSEAVYYIDGQVGTNYIPTTASGYMYLPGVASNNATSPDSAALDITGDIDLRVKVALDNWIPSVQSVLIAKSNLTTSQASYFMSVNTDGTLNITWYANGSTAISKNSTVITGVANGAVKWVRATLDVDNGSAGNDVKFYLSDDGSTWTQLGDTVTTASTTSIFNSTAVLSIGMTTASGGTTALARGKFYRAQVLNGIGGTTVFDANFETAMTSQTVTSFTESSSNAATVTINRTTYNFQLDTIANLGSAGSLLPTTLGSSTAADSNDPKFLDHTGTNYVYTVGVGANYLSVPDAAALDITGDIDLRVQVALDDWTPAAQTALMSKRQFLDTERSWSLFVQTDGKISLVHSSDGTTFTNLTTETQSSVATGIADGSTKWIRATLDVDNGASGKTYRYYTSDDGTTWTQLGTDITIAGTTSIFSSTSQIGIGGQTAGASGLLAGKIFRAQIFDGIDGTKVLDVDTSVITAGSATSFTAVTGQTVTINRSTSGRKTVAVTQPTWLFGTDDYMEVNNRYMSSGTYLYLPGVSGNTATSPDAAALDITGDIDIRAKIAMDDWTPSASNALIAKYGTAGQRSYYLALGSSTGLLQLNWSADGTNVITKNSTVAPTITDGSTLWVRVTLDVDNGASGNTVTFYTSTDGTTWTQLGDAVVTAGTTSIHSGTSILEIGTWGAGNAIARGKFFRAQVLDGIDGTVAFDANFETSITSLLQTSFTESSANAATVTINRSGSAYRSAGITQAGYLYPGATNTFTASATDFLNFGAGDSFTFLMVHREWDTAASTVLLANRTIVSATVTPGYWLATNTASGGINRVYTGVSGSDASVSTGNTAETGWTSGALNTHSTVVDRSTNLLSLTKNAGTASTASISAIATSSANFNTIRIGTGSPTLGSYAAMELVAVAVWRRRLLAPEIGAIYEYFNARD